MDNASRRKRFHLERLPIAIRTRHEHRGHRYLRMITALEDTPQDGRGRFTPDDVLGAVVKDVHLHHIPEFGFEDQVHLYHDVLPLDGLASAMRGLEEVFEAGERQTCRVLDKGLLTGLKLQRQARWRAGLHILCDEVAPVRRARQRDLDVRRDRRREYAVVHLRLGIGHQYNKVVGMG